MALKDFASWGSENPTSACAKGSCKAGSCVGGSDKPISACTKGSCKAGSCVGSSDKKDTPCSSCK